MGKRNHNEWRGGKLKINSDKACHMIQGRDYGGHYLIRICTAFLAAFKSTAFIKFTQMKWLENRNEYDILVYSALHRLTSAKQLYLDSLS